MHSHEHLLALIELWMEARPIGLAGNHEPRAVSEALLATITTREPYRSQAIADAREYLAMPKLVGIGLIYEIVDPVAIVPFDMWDSSISRLTIKLLWSRTMDSGFTDYAYDQLDRVAVEDNRWKNVSVWDEASRKESLMFLEQLRRLK